MGQAPSSPQQFRPERTPAELVGRTHVMAVMTLKDPVRTARPLPRLLRRQLPDPTRSIEDWERFIGADLAGATPAQRRRERARLGVAVALVDDPDRVPTWVIRRLEELGS